MREQEQAERRAERADAAERKRQEQLAHEAGVAAAKAMKEQLDTQVDELQTLLTSVLGTPPRLPFAALKRTLQAPAFSPGDLDKPSPALHWEDFAPPPPGVVSGLLGGKARHARAVAEAQETYEQAVADHDRRESQRIGYLRQAREAYDKMIKDLQAEIHDHNAAVDELEHNFLAGVPDAVEEYFTEVLALSQYPPGFPHQYQVAYRAEPRELVVEYRLPPAEVVPTERDYRYVKVRRQIDKLSRSAKEIKELYASVVQQMKKVHYQDVVAAWDKYLARRATGHSEERF